MGLNAQMTHGGTVQQPKAAQQQVAQQQQGQSWQKGEQGGARKASLEEQLAETHLHGYVEEPNCYD